MDFVSYQDFLFFIKDKTDEALQIVLILVGSGLLIRAVRILADRLVKFVRDDDPLTTESARTARHNPCWHLQGCLQDCDRSGRRADDS